jgi:hypothetical protein
MAYTGTQLLFILAYHQLFKWDFITGIENTIQLISAQQPQMQAEAQQVANSIQGNIPVIYTTTPYEHGNHSVEATTQ